MWSTTICDVYLSTTEYRQTHERVMIPLMIILGWLCESWDFVLYSQPSFNQRSGAQGTFHRPGQMEATKHIISPASRSMIRNTRLISWNKRRNFSWSQCIANSYTCLIHEEVHERHEPRSSSRLLAMHFYFSETHMTCTIYWDFVYIVTCRSGWS